MGDVEIQLARLTATVEAGFRDTGRRFDVQDRQLTLIDQQVRITNGRVTALETKNAVRETSERDKSEDGSLENKTLTWKSIGQALTVIGLTGGGVYWFLTSLMGFHR